MQNLAQFKKNMVKGQKVRLTNHVKNTTRETEVVISQSKNFATKGYMDPAGESWIEYPKVDQYKGISNTKGEIYGINNVLLLTIELI